MTEGNFTLPGEAGYEKLTLDLARRWGADVIRDSDGTKLSDEILSAGYGIYSTICLIREHNAWIRDNLDARQQSFLCTSPCLAEGDVLRIKPMEEFFAGQFEVDARPEALALWQVYDRTTGQLLPQESWSYDESTGTVTIKAVPWRRYTVSFLAWRVWEEISMYNHVTNSWNAEHLMQLNPYHPAAMTYLRGWLRDWCAGHPATTVVRFTSLFYNFAWIWGSSEENRNLFSDWASYDFTVSIPALRDFEAEYGYALTAEDFVNKGLYNATHCVPTAKKRDWMAFIGRFVRHAGKEFVDIVHAAGKQAYVFYDDSWVGMEPYSGYFDEFGFDGLIKCVFSGFEVRLCAGVPVKTHELRFHPYLFPTGLGGLPTFSPGGDPARDALDYWVNVRRALLRQKIERTGLGGYLHLVQDYPCFVEAMDGILREFRQISALHDAGGPVCMKPTIGILHAWGQLRSWTLSGHFHETYRHVLIHVLESLSGMPFDVRFLSFNDVRQGVPQGIDVLINAGEAGSAWSGGECWGDHAVVESLSRWVHEGGVFMGIGEPSALAGQDSFFRMAHVLGLDMDTGARSCHGRWPVKARPEAGLVPQGVSLPERPALYLTGAGTRVLATAGAAPAMAINTFGRGKGVYLSGFETGPAATRMLQNLLLYAQSGGWNAQGVTDSAETECAVFSGAGVVVLVNNSPKAREAACEYGGRRYTASLAPYGMAMVELEGAGFQPPKQEAQQQNQ